MPTRGAALCRTCKRAVRAEGAPRRAGLYPTPRQIREALHEIRSGWSPEERAARRRGAVARGA